MSQQPNRDDSNENSAVQPEELREVGRYSSLDQAHEHGLVILAMRKSCMVSDTETPGSYSLYGDSAAAAEITRELLAYKNEQQVAPPVASLASETFRHSAGWGVYGIWMFMLVWCYSMQIKDPTLVERAASSSIGLIGGGEWWRPFTALFLHGDAAHLIGNLLSGLIFGTLVARSIGAWRAWGFILACGTIGNVLTSALTWPESFTSIGASSAVFGALGILAGFGFVATLRQRIRLPWARTAAPVLAGIILLGWLGGGSEGGNTDVLGHVFGFSTGLVTGCLIAGLEKNPPPSPDDAS